MGTAMLSGSQRVYAVNAVGEAIARRGGWVPLSGHERNPCHTRSCGAGFSPADPALRQCAWRVALGPVNPDLEGDTLFGPFSHFGISTLCFLLSVLDRSIVQCQWSIVRPPFRVFSVFRPYRLALTALRLPPRACLLEKPVISGEVRGTNW